MGTSTSSKGGGPRSPFDPEWLDGSNGGDGGGNADGIGDGQGGDGEGDGAPQGDRAPTQPLPTLNPARRLAGARSAMSGALSGGGRDAF